MKFPFFVSPSSPCAAFPARTSVKRPILPLTLWRGAASVSIFGVIDSGADQCIFPASLAGRLGIALPNKREYIFSGTAEKPQVAYFESLRVDVWSLRPERVNFSFDLYAGFCDTLEHVGMGLLGQDGFFSRFKVSLDHANDVIELESR